MHRDNDLDEMHLVDGSCKRPIRGAQARDSSEVKQDTAQHARDGLKIDSHDSHGPDLASVAKLRAALESVPSVPIEKAAELLNLSVRTLYRNRSEFEYKRHKGHLYFTIRSIKEHIEIEQYNPTSSFDITIADDFDISDGSLFDNRIRRTSNDC